MIQSDYKVHGAYGRGSLIVAHGKGMQNGPVRTFKPDKDGNLVLVKETEVTFLLAANEEKFNCLECGNQASRSKTASHCSRKIYCIGCSTNRSNAVKARYQRKRRELAKAKKEQNE